MDSRKKELKIQYKEQRPDMGIIAFISKNTANVYIGVATDIKGRINRNRFQLECGLHPNKKLQREWSEAREEGFEIKVLERLEYDKDLSKTDYSADLQILFDDCIEKTLNAKKLS